MYRRYRKYDKELTGVLVGAAFPLIWYFLLLQLFTGMEAMEWIPAQDPLSDFRQRTSALVAICLNIVPLQIFKVQYMDRAMRGIVFPTVILVGLWLYLFGDSVW